MQVPVGRGTLGRIMNVIGEPVDECGPIGEQSGLSTAPAAVGSEQLAFSNKAQQLAATAVPAWGGCLFQHKAATGRAQLSFSR